MCLSALEEIHHSFRTTSVSGSVVCAKLAASRWDIGKEGVVGLFLKLEPSRRRHDVSAVAGTEGSSGCSPSTTSTRHSGTGFGPLPRGSAQPPFDGYVMWGQQRDSGLEVELRHRGVCVLVTMGAPAPATATRADLTIGRARFMISDERLSRLATTRDALGTSPRRGLKAYLAGVWRRATADLGEGVACISLVGRIGRP
jgi:hypothetical protein